MEDGMYKCKESYGRVHEIEGNRLSSRNKKSRTKHVELRREINKLVKEKDRLERLISLKEQKLVVAVVSKLDQDELEKKIRVARCSRREN
jgi:hypothetical protein